jgi:hypothetical protein
MIRTSKFITFKAFIIKCKEARILNLKAGTSKRLRWLSKDKININNTESFQLTWLDSQNKRGFTKLDK